MNICLIQTDPRGKRENVRHLRTAIERFNADLYLVPELFTTGFDSLVQHGPRDAEAIPGGLTCRQIQSFVQNGSSAVVCGLLERFGSDFYNVAAVIQNGLLDKYRQKYPPTQLRNLRILPGEYEDVAVSSRWNIGLMVCSDHYMAESFFEEYQKRNVSAVVLVADSSTRAWLTGFPHLCQQYRLPAIVCNAAGPSGGASCVINTAGEFVRLQTQQGTCDYLPEMPIAGTAAI